MRPIHILILGLACILTGTACQGADGDNLQKKAEEGDAYSQLDLGTDYLYGSKGVSKDSAKAVEWLLKASNGFPHNTWLRCFAFFEIGIAYEDVSTTKTPPEAVEWYLKAAMLNDPRAMGGLSRIYERGADGVPRDIIEALAWMYVMAESGNPGTIDNDGIKLGISHLERQTDEKGALLARKRCDEITAEIKKNKDALHKS